jgi:hypothetical protein
MQPVLDVIPRKVTGPMKDKFIAEIKQSEVKAALFEMFPTKTSGSDGFPHTSSSGIGIYVVKK